MGYYYHHDRTRDKYSSLIRQLSEKRDAFCGIGTRKVKIRLNKLAKTDAIAALYRKALEIEDKNIQAKAYPTYRDKYYEEKSLLIDELIKACMSEGIKVGYSSEVVEYKERIDDYDAFGRRIYNPDPDYEIMEDVHYIVYFELPDCEQISWHCMDKPDCPLYDGVWDGQTNSTLPKLERAILSKYPEITAK